MDCIERLMRELKQEIETLHSPKSKNLQLVKDYLQMAEVHYKKMGKVPRRYGRKHYTPPGL